MAGAHTLLRQKRYKDVILTNDVLARPRDAVTVHQDRCCPLTSPVVRGWGVVGGGTSPLLGRPPRSVLPSPGGPARHLVFHGGARDRKSTGKPTEQLPPELASVWSTTVNLLTPTPTAPQTPRQP